jgi:hypothetical protein
MKDKDKAPYGKGKMKKPMPGMQNRPGKKMAPKPAAKKTIKEANPKMKALKNYLSGMKKGKK